MQFTQPRHLLAAGVVALVLGHLGARFAYGGLPPLPLLAGVTLLLIAAIDLVLALNFRPRIQRRPGTEPVNALTAARAVALAKASSMVGAIMAGAWIGLRSEERRVGKECGVRWSMNDENKQQNK